MTHFDFCSRRIASTLSYPLSVLVLVLSFSLLPSQPVFAACTATGPNLGAAIRNYAESCSLPRVDCDPISGGWMCSSESMGNGAPNQPTTSTPAPMPIPEPMPQPEPTPEPPPPVAEGPCWVTDSSLGQALSTYAQYCSVPRLDCDPGREGWVCASVRMSGGNFPTNPAANAGETPAQEPQPTPDPVPVSEPPTQAGLPTPPNGFAWRKIEAASDEFNGTSLDSNKWLNDHPYWNGREPSQFLPSNVSVGGGNLQLKSTVRNANRQGNWVNSAAVSSRTRFGQGYYEARLKESNISMTSSFWFQGRGLEIDVVENLGRPTRRASRAFEMAMNSHYFPNGFPSDNTPAKWVMPYRAGADYHVYGVWWKSERDLWFYHNGVKVQEMRTAGPFTKDQLMFFDTEVFSWEGMPTLEGLKKSPMAVEYDFQTLCASRAFHIIRRQRLCRLHRHLHAFK